MSSTDRTQHFFHEAIAPAAKSLAAGGHTFFRRTATLAETYWGARERSSDYVYEFAGPNLADELKQLWTDEPQALLALADGLAALADTMRGAPEREDVSAFIYAMF